jgi:hypothetical protein
MLLYGALNDEDGFIHYQLAVGILPREMTTKSLMP